MWLAGQRRGQPIETGCDAFAGEGRASENLPRPIAERRQVEGIRYFRGRHATAHVLLVRPHEDRRALQVFIRRNPVQLCARQRHAIAVITVDHKNERISRSHVLGPARTERRLSTDVPQQELEVLVLKRLGIRADRRRRRHDRAQRHFIHNRGLACIIKAQDTYFELLLPKERGPQAAERDAHGLRSLVGARPKLTPLTDLLGCITCRERGMRQPRALGRWVASCCFEARDT